jgi:WD40 repeat protein
LRLEAGGPTSYVTAVAFSPDGKTLYAAGWDKVVRVWTLNPQGRFVLDTVSYRVPIGPGLAGAINAIALSDDGEWLAVGGLGVFRGEAGFRQPGLILPSIGALTTAMRQDQGMIYVFNTRTRAVRLLRGHVGAVLALTFAPDGAGSPPRLVSAAREWDDGKYVGVVRLWDVDKSAFADGIGELPDGTARPGLAVWRSGPGPNQLQAGIAWDDGVFRVWDVERSRVHALKDQRYNITAAAYPGDARFLTAEYGTKKPTLRRWQLAAGAEPQAEDEASGAGAQADAFPRALALVSSQANGGADYAATVVRVPSRGDEYRLQLLTLGEGVFGAVKSDVLLWKGSAKQPVLAAAPRGNFLAVAGNEEHEIQVYALNDLLQGGHAPQLIHSVGVRIRSAGFVTKGGQWGLLLSETPLRALGDSPGAPAAGDLVFDLSRHALTADLQGWGLTTSKVGDWKATAAAREGRWTVRVDDNAGNSREIKLKENQVVTSYALLPPQGPRQTPMLAVAYQEPGQVMLDLYDARSGAQFRQLTAHSDPINSLAFSGDGRFLISAAEDQTVCVWTLTNADKILGQLGQLPGVAVKAGPDNTIVVAKIGEDSPARDKLREGDIIEGLMQKAGVRPLPSPRDFYETIAGLKPGQKIALQVRGPNGARGVSLPILQGIDERKPLFSFFMTRAAKPDDRDWIGWTPIGPYESSGANAERYLGWHFNTGEAASPTRFARGDQYRKYYREHLLRDLLVAGDFKRLAAGPPPGPPRLGLLIDENGTFPERDNHGQIAVRQPRINLRLAISGRPVDTLQSATWNLDGGENHPLDLDSAAAGELTVPLEVKRGIHKVRVAIRTPEAGEEYSEELTLRYQPSAPRLEFTRPKYQSTLEENFTLRTPIELAPGVAEAVATIKQVHKDKAVVEEQSSYTADSGKPKELLKEFKLRPGRNLLEVVAVNKDALPGYEDQETSRLTLEVTRIEKAQPPVISLGVVNLAATGPGQLLAVEPGKEVVVHDPNVRLAGTIEAKENLTEAVLVNDLSGKRTNLGQFTPNQAKDWKIEEDLTLSPGAQIVRIQARTATSDEAENKVTLRYQPVPPSTVITQPRPNQVVQGEKDQGEVALEARLEFSKDRRPFEAKIINGDKEIANLPVQIDDKTGTLTAKLALNPGPNRVRVRLSNEWQGASTSEDLVVRYVRPPKIVRVTAPAESKQPLLAFAARIRSALPVTAKDITVEVNGAKRTAQLTLTEDPAEKGTWDIQFRDVPLDPSAPESRLRLWVRNSEAQCAEAGTATVRFHPVIPPPKIEFLQPRDNTSVDTARVSVRFKVRSASPLKKLQIAREGDSPIGIEVAQLTASADGQFEITSERELRLTSGINHVTIAATNAGGEQSATQLLNYLNRPVRLVIDSLLPRQAGSEPVKPREQTGGKLLFPEVLAGRLRLQGRVLWDEDNDERLQKTRIIRVFVNGFQQLPALLQPAAAGSRVRTFQTDLLLNQAAGNQVEVALPDLEEDSCDCTRFSLTCQNPERAQRLHLLIVSNSGKDEKTIKNQFLQAFQATFNPQGQLKTPAFEPVYTYGPLIGAYVQPGYVYKQLQKIQATIKGLARAGSSFNDVVVLYYEGREAVNAQGNVFQTQLTCDDIVRFFADIPGAHVLLFDVGRGQAAAADPSQDKIAHWESSYRDVKNHVAVLRYAWLGKDSPFKDPRLLTALKEAMPQSYRLRDVAEQVKQATQGNGSDTNQARLYEYLSEEMKEMVFGPKKP